MRFHSLSLFLRGRVFGSIFNFNFNFNCNLTTTPSFGFGCPSPNTTIQALPAAVAPSLLRCPHPTTTVLRNGSSSSSNGNNRSTQQNQKMTSRSEHQNQQQSTNNNTNNVSLISSDPNVIKLQQIMQSTSSDRWEKCWEEGLTPWDLGQPTPVMVNLHWTGALPKGRALVPGCGSGYDVVEIACPERYVVGVDISDKAIRKAKELSSSSPNSDYFTFLKEDFFTWHPSELFDLIFDYTFFCAIEPDMRPAWARRMRDLLKPDGELITLMFPISDHVGGPPYKASIADYEEVLHPVGFKAVSIVENELAIGPRKGKEKLGRWKKFMCQPLL